MQPTKIKNIPIYYRVGDAEKATGISKSHLWTLINKGILPSFSPSPKIRLIKVEDLLTYIESSKTGAKHDN